mgnify:CR=1 FL=1
MSKHIIINASYEQWYSYFQIPHKFLKNIKTGLLSFI